MSKIQAKLAELTEQVPSRRSNEQITDQSYMQRLATGVDGLTDDEFNALPPEVSAWYNAAADAIETKQPIPVFPDMITATADAGAGVGRRRAASAAAATPWVPSKGDTVDFTTKRGKSYTSASIVVVDDTGYVFKTTDGQEIEIDKDKVATIAQTGATTSQQPPADTTPQIVEPHVGATVKVETARGKIVTGKITELVGDEMVAVDAAGEIHEFSKSKLKSVQVLASANPGAAAATSPASNPAAAEQSGQRRASAANNGGVTVTGRIRQLIAANLKATKEDIGAVMRKEGLEFKDATLDLTYNDAHKLIGILREAGHFKA
jgi:hypothetical protein